MADDDSKLTRRRVLGGLATVGAAGAIGGAGTWAAFSDDEDSNGNYVQAGTRDLQIDGGDAPVVTLEVDNAAPGDSGGDTSSITNVGSLPGDLSVEVMAVRSAEGDNSSEAETNTDTSDNGELAQYLNVDIGFGSSSAVSGSAQGLAGSTGSGPTLSANGGSTSFYIDWSIDPGATNDAQGDRVEIDVKVYLE